jgi:ATP-binding cassette subfamily F protein 3
VIQLRHCRYAVGSRVLFEELDWTIGSQDRCALVGPNGSGKTTLLRILVGELAPESGTRIVGRGTRIGYLPQEAAERFEGTVLDRALEARRDLRAMRAELDDLHQRLGSAAPDEPSLPAWLDRAGDLQHRLEHHAEHALEPEARRLLSGLGFPPTVQDRPLVEFSGGWRMRAALAALLLSEPTLLLLDEPTNHLDLPALEWVEDYLDGFDGGLVVVSHDRVFLDRIATEVRELEDRRLVAYPMGVTRYLEERERRREQVEARNLQIERKIAQLDRFVERFGAKNTKATQAQSKLKQIARLRSERIVLPRRPKSVRFDFPPPPHAGRFLVQLREAAFSYGAEPVFTGANLALGRGEKVAIVGANGAGKTTLLRVVAGQLEPGMGALEISPLCRMALFAQHAAEALEANLTVLEALEQKAPADWRPHLRSLLGRFLFSGDDVFKRCGVLSGGERQRVALARILLEPANLLLLDEPTHHLDLASKEVLEEALAQYPGAVLVVTHDRSLMARIAGRLIEIEGGRVIPYPGGYDDYESSRLARISAAPAPGPAPASSAASSAASRRPAMEPARRGSGPPSAHRARELKRIEADVEQRESRRREIESLLGDAELYRDGARARELLGEYHRLQAELDSLWQRLSEL